VQGDLQGSGRRSVVEEGLVYTCGTTWCSWMQGGMVVDGEIDIITNLKSSWRNVEFDFKL